MAQNELLKRLLTLQQDGQHAISGPANWVKDVVLKVRTSLDEVIDELEQVVAPTGDDPRPGRWHFFVGSPGNGKSAGAGDLARRLRQRGDVIHESDSGRSLEELAPSDVPYQLNVYQQDKQYPYLFIAQDASVLPNPFDSEADPASALEDLLKDAAERGVSLVVCTNRGVIERLFSRGHIDSTKSAQPWFKAVRMAVGVNVDSQGKITFPSEDKKRRVFDSVEVRVTSLDRRSLLLGENDTLENLVMEAIHAKEWESCETCPSRSLCPFRANRDWLAEPDLRKNTLTLFRRAELFDGQVIVLREALALLSFLLAGCPHDYDSDSPCEWVHQRYAEGDIFALAGRRIYMGIFSSYSPLGLASSAEDSQMQKDAIRKVLKAKDHLSDSSVRALKGIVESRRNISTDVGAQRLLGNEKTFSALDPFSDVLSLDFLDRWNESWTAIEAGGPWLSGIEKACNECWAEIQKVAAATVELSSTDYRWLVRWITAFTIRAGALVEGKSTFGEDLDELANILCIQGAPTKQQNSLLRKIEEMLEQSLQSVDKGITISPSASLRGDWVRRELRPRLPTERGDGVISATLAFGTSNKTKIPLSTKAFVWLKRRAERKMSLATFPSEYLETARDAMLRAAVTSGYDIQDDVEIEIVRPNEPPIKLERSRGSTYVDDK